MNYNGLSQEYTIKAGDLAGTFVIVSGGIYRIKTNCQNSIGFSSDSEELIVALASLPNTPKSP